MMSVNTGASGRRTTLREVAMELGVSPATVSNAYNRPDQLSPALRERVFETARRLGYTGPDPLGRGLRRGHAGAIGVLYPNRLSYAFNDPAAVSFLSGVSAAAEEEGLGLLLVPGSPPEERDPSVIARAMVDGFAIYSLAEDDPLVETVLERRLPAVIIDQPRVEGVPFIGVDNKEAARIAAQHLLDLGHRRFGVVSFALSRSPSEEIADLHRQETATYLLTRSRLMAYAAAISAAGLSWGDVPVYECADSAPELGKRAAEVLLSQDPRPTALLALSDQLALGAIDAVRERGLSVPGDVSVVGFDDIPVAARTQPPLTTVYQPHFEKGLLAGRILIAQLQGEELPTPGLLPTRLVVRGSTAPT